jgi:hypothetical protein
VEFISSRLSPENIGMTQLINTVASDACSLISHPSSSWAAINASSPFMYTKELA